MMPEQQRIAIAEACGYEPNAYAESHHTWAPAEIASIPDYLNDLNAMHEVLRYAAENLMDADEWERLGHELERQHPNAMIKGTDGKPDYHDFATLVAELTAANIAEAFLKTKGLWRGEPS